MTWRYLQWHQRIHLCHICIFSSFITLFVRLLFWLVWPCGLTQSLTPIGRLLSRHAFTTLASCKRVRRQFARSCHKSHHHPKTSHRISLWLSSLLHSIGELLSFWMNFWIGNDLHHGWRSNWIWVFISGCISFGVSVADRLIRLKRTSSCCATFRWDSCLLVC